ncbi:MAG: Transcription initiation factor TFIID subunit 13 [Marteilia pararefringens]
MYSYGDSINPNKQSIEYLEKIVKHYLTSITLQSMDIAKKRKIQMSSLMAVIKHSMLRYNRASELLDRNQDLKRARKYFDDKQFEKIN